MSEHECYEAAHSEQSTTAGRTDFGRFATPLKAHLHIQLVRTSAGSRLEPKAPSRRPALPKAGLECAPRFGAGQEVYVNTPDLAMTELHVAGPLSFVHFRRWAAA